MFIVVIISSYTTPQSDSLTLEEGVGCSANRRPWLVRSSRTPRNNAVSLPRTTSHTMPLLSNNPPPTFQLEILHDKFKDNRSPYEQKEYKKKIRKGENWTARRRTLNHFFSCPADPSPGYDADAVSVVLDWNRRYPLRLRWHGWDGWVHLSTRHSLHKDLALWISDPTRMRCPTWQHSCHRFDMPSRWFSWPRLISYLQCLFPMLSILLLTVYWLPECK